MRNHPTPGDRAAQYARSVAKMNNYAAMVSRSQADLQRAAFTVGMQNANAYSMRRYGGRVAAPRDKPLREKRCGGILLRDVPRLQRAMCGRGSWLQQRRRAAHDACLAMIQLREAALAISLSSSPLV